ncbi:MAG: hypothetical protein JSV92_01935 [archaeon]|nr:MAG: hypothetical protein JSV92_01935 [archaeon]
MTILTKVKGSESRLNKLLFGGNFGTFSEFSIDGESYYLFYPYQALALQKLGVELEFYKSSKPLYREFPFVPEGTIAGKAENLKPQVEDSEIFDKYVEKLRSNLGGD